MSIALACLCYAIMSWTIVPVNRVVATTTIRLWHELHKQKKHDFVFLVAPTPNGSSYFASVHCDEIRALAVVRDISVGKLCIQGIAYHPEQFAAIGHLLEGMMDQHASLDTNPLFRDSQPKVYCEAMFKSSSYTSESQDA